jgi:hypothetical protein
LLAEIVELGAVVGLTPNMRLNVEIPEALSGVHIYHKNKKICPAAQEKSRDEFIPVLLL